MIHVLHIRKTGGSALGGALAPVAGRLGIVFRAHEVRLADIAVGERIVFCVRSPLDRFCSGFNSRLRCGRPRNDRPWTADEARAFARFTTPNALAEALGSSQSALRAEAEAAVAAIPHLVPLRYWLGSVAELHAREPDILAILSQAELDSDFAAFCDRLGIGGDLRLPQDDVGSHRTPAGFTTHLSPTAQAILRDIYAEDFPLYDACMALRARCAAREQPVNDCWSKTGSA